MNGSDFSSTAGATESGCAEAAAGLPRYLDGEMDAPERRRLEAHLVSCAGCRAELAELRGALETLAALPAPGLPAREAFREELRGRIATLPPPRPGLRRRLGAWLHGGALPGPLPALGLATALGLLLAIGLLRTPRPASEPPAAEVAVGGEASESLGIGMNLEILRDLDVLEALDDLETVPPSPNTTRPGRLG